MGLLSKDAILAAADINFQTVPVPEWGGDVKIRSMSGADRDAHELWLTSQPEKEGGGFVLSNLRAHMAALSIVGEDGELLFNEADVVALGKKSAAALDRVYQAIITLNAIGPKDVEALEKK